MKPAQIYQQYIWLINAFRRYRQMTLDELNEHWMREGVADGNPLPRTTFNRHRDAILDMFGVIIDCDVKDHYKYYIANPEVLLDDSLERWMLSTMTVGGVLSDSVSLKDRIILENVPAGEEYLETIISAIKAGKKILMQYQRFGADSLKVITGWATSNDAEIITGSIILQRSSKRSVVMLSGFWTNRDKSISASVLSWFFTSANP